MKSPVISVLMPLYDAKDFLADAIESILEQSFRELEFIIVDDSSDGSYEIAASYAEKDPRIKLIKNDPPLGLRRSSNLGLKEAKGKYVARMEADDVSLPGRLEKQVDFMEAHPEVDVSGGQMQLFGQEESTWNYYESDAEIKAAMIWSISIPHPCCIMRREFIETGGYYYNEEGLPYAEDWELFYNMSSDGTFANLPDVLYKYRRSSGSVTKRMKEHRREVNRKMLSRILGDFGVEVSEDNLDLHQFNLSNFKNTPTPEDVEAAREWVDGLYFHNKKVKKYDPSALERVCEDRWDRLFYKLVPYGRSVINTYFKVSPSKKKDHLLYYYKSRFNAVIGRK